MGHDKALLIAAQSFTGIRVSSVTCGHLGLTGC